MGVQKKIMKKWKCVICGLIVEGFEPPETCPACGAGKEQFIEVVDDTTKFSSSSSEKIIIIGNGATGYYAAKAIREKNQVCEINIISSEKYLTYYRPQLSDYLSSSIPDEEFYISSERWYKDNNINLLLDTTVVKIVPDEKKIVLEDSLELFYTKLILANGSHNFMPSLKGSDKVGVFTLKNLDDAIKIKSEINNCKNAVIIGGGLLGLEAAWAMKEKGLNVTVIEHNIRLLPRQLDDAGAEIFKQFVDASGVKTILGGDTEEIIGDKNVTGIKLKDGKIINADMILVSVGIRSNKEIAENCGIAVNNGVIVNENMETNIENIYACGDVAEYNKRVFGNWPAAIEMGTTAGSNSIGDEMHFKNFVPSTIFKAMNTELFSCGTVTDQTAEQKQLNEDISGKTIYNKLFYKDGKLIGGILIGDTSQSVKIMQDME